MTTYPFFALPRYLKIIRNKKIDAETIRYQKRKFRIRAVLGLLICALIHTGLFFLFTGLFPDELHPEPRASYVISILLTLAVFTLLLGFGMFLKGSSTLPRHQGPVSGV